tara:strand:- start:198 stop:464 length:267 start_codon:yes stop_codon:yes gene_type:complete
MVAAATTAVNADQLMDMMCRDMVKELPRPKESSDIVIVKMCLAAYMGSWCEGHIRDPSSIVKACNEFINRTGRWDIDEIRGLWPKIIE